MSSFPVTDNSGATSTSETPPETEHSTLPFSPITASVSPEPELQAILEQATERTAATGAAIVLSTDEAVCCRASIGAAPEVGTPLQAGISLTALCLDSGEILLSNDTNTDPRVNPQLGKETGIRSVLVLPIKQNAKVMGVLEVLSINPNAFNQNDAAAMSELADQVLPLLSESAIIPDRCLKQLPSNEIEAVKEQNDLRPTTHAAPTTDAAEAPKSNGHHARLDLSDQTALMTSQDRSGASRRLAAGLATGLAVTLALALIGYGYQVSRRKAATHVPILPMAAAERKPVIEQADHSNGQPKVPASVLTGTRQEAILAIQEAVQSTDVNPILNRASAGDSIAQYEMAVRYADGKGVPQNYQDAMAWFAKAAAHANEKAQWKLGLGYMKGIGVPQDEGKAVDWFKRAANGGDVRAQSALSEVYFSGRGVPIDYVRALTWANIAAGMRGNDNDRLKVIISRMTATQIEDANRRASIWWKKRGTPNPAGSQRTALSDTSNR
jgi:putative methionine-R-sulfoxide reductase with GAF domain